MSGDLGNIEANAEGKAEFHLEVYPSTHPHIQ